MDLGALIAPTAFSFRLSYILRELRVSTLGMECDVSAQMIPAALRPHCDGGLFSLYASADATLKLFESL